MSPIPTNPTSETEAPEAASTTSVTETAGTPENPQMYTADLSQVTDASVDHAAMSLAAVEALKAAADHAADVHADGEGWLEEEFQEIKAKIQQIEEWLAKHL